MSIHWKSAVSVRIGNGITDLIKGPSEAFEHLNNRWPAERGRLYVEAKGLCSAAIADATANDTSRDAFVEAAVEAKILV